jgi:diguanylate cyclase (GGDEF)-like protein/PAS domain S-box-containing protein
LQQFPLLELNSVTNSKSYWVRIARTPDYYGKQPGYLMMQNNNLFTKFMGVFTNDPSLFGATVDSESLAGRIRAKQLYMLQRYAPNLLLANLINTFLLILSFAGTGNETAVIAWSATLAVFVLYSFHCWRREFRNSSQNYVPANAPRKAIAMAFLHGLIWAAFPLLFIGSHSNGSQLIILAVTIGTMGAGAATFATIPGAVVVFVGPIVAGSIISLRIHDIAFAPHISLLLALFAFVLAQAAFGQARLFASRIINEDEQRKKNDMIGMLLGEFEENASDWLWETDSLGRIAYISTKFSELANLPMETLKGKSLLRVMARGADGPPQPVKAWRTITEQLQQRKAFRDLELQIWADGQSRWCKMTGKPIYSETGQFTGFRGFCSDVTKKRADEEKIAYLASFDAVTKLPNRVSFGEEMDRSFSLVHQGKYHFTLHCIDLDGFKDINDTFGHAIGDAFLQETAHRIAACLGEDDYVARLGGDEFSVIQAHCRSEVHAAKLAKALIESIGMPLTVAGNTMKAGASIGIAFAAKDGETREAIMVNADLALYRAKAEGRGIFRFYDSSMDEMARERRKMEAELRTAIDKQELKLLFQPILDVATGRINNCEALLRWDNASMGQVSPADFIPVAEECGLIISISEWVIQEACREASSWPGNVKVAVNLSPVQFQSPGLLPVIMKALEQTGLSANRLEIEITETVLLSNIERVLAIIDTLERLGVRIALDDFGTGYSSLAYIRQINFDKIKIDASFVRDMINDKSCAAIIRAVTGLAHELEIRITAEGVETQQQMDALIAEGCAEMQGYLISQPLPPEKFVEFVSESHQQARQVA